MRGQGMVEAQQMFELKAVVARDFRRVDGYGCRADKTEVDKSKENPE